MSIRNAAKAIIIRDHRLLVTQNQAADGSFYLLPGGGQEHGETLVDCLRRECREEIGAAVTVGPLRFVRDYIGRNHEFADQHGHVHAVEFMFECELLGEPGEYGSQPDIYQTGILWLPLAEVLTAPLFPQGLRRHLASHQGDAVTYLGDIN
jgi:8-oxo-dGTP pyrophosphatase MutT (NUDIX family)